jgi:hypothetical protein
MSFSHRFIFVVIAPLQNNAAPTRATGSIHGSFPGSRFPIVQPHAQKAMGLVLYFGGDIPAKTVLPEH